ncbi:kelch repeat protein-like protein [Aaosphaeria arxii CBS 175.79]|uniref:Kelch repeat protein-like protein n=1 Tax=Aaosphaeria arxii CBS 175.79 TaxID=1450172 RepID=A0A6A5XX49_9PLEO|nr:kelch repeat protein-like protein [Aaosphaeria arxii CBS 175.79]KAF2017483.1 kelch repeat protein-like protein [Aaosphaeria arxii CBS 175.79]
MPISTFTGKWTKLLSTERLRRSSQIVSVVDQKICIFGGEVLPRQPIDNQIDILPLNPASPNLQTKSSSTAPSPRVGTASAVSNGKLYLFSGRGGTDMAPIEENGAVWSYDVEKASWEKLNPANTSKSYPQARSYHCATSDSNGSFFIHAGCPTSGRSSDLWKFDVSSRIWTQLPDAPAPPRGGTSITSVGGKLYRMNGFDGEKEQGGHVDIFDLASNSWSTQTFKPDGNDGPEPRSVCTLLPIRLFGKQKLITMFGEHDPSSLGHAGAGKMLSDIWIYDIVENWWTKIDSVGANGVPQPRGWFGADVARDEEGKEHIVVHGGLAEDNSRLTDVWLLHF